MFLLKLGLFFSLYLLVYCTKDARRLYDDLMRRQGYDSTVRPVKSFSSTVLLFMNLTLVQILDVDEKNQIIILNMWVNQEWNDPNFLWDPLDYGNVTELNIPSREIWTPDLVLYNNAGGDWDLASSSNTKVIVKYDGSVLWKPPVIFKSQCEIDVEFFPFDKQNCKLKIGTWTHNGFLIDLRHTAQRNQSQSSFDNCNAAIDYAIDLSQYVSNVEWDLLQASANRNIEFYPCCTEPYLDISFYVSLRRRTLFYGINLICPCLAISFLTILVFYLPADSGEKVSLSISILLSLTVFFLLIFDISPPTSIVVPLILKYLLFTMILVTLSVMATVLVLNIHWRSPDTHQMAPWVRSVFTDTLPRMLFMKKPDQEYRGVEIAEIYSIQKLHNKFSSIENTHFHNHQSNLGLVTSGHNTPGNGEIAGERPASGDQLENDINQIQDKLSARRAAVAGDNVINEIELALEGVRKIVHHIKKDDSFSAMRDDWKYVAVVLDRLFLWLFSIAAIIGMMGIFMQAPTLTDNATPMTALNCPAIESINVTKLTCETKGAS